MLRRPSRTGVAFIAVSLFLVQIPPDVQAQIATPTPQQLDQLLAPIALYPDSLLAQITTASTNPQEILDVDNWLAANPGLSGSALSDAAQQQGFDPAFIALVHFPTVLQMMAENIDDYAAIGQAVSTNQAEVSASIQRLRAQAYAAGVLRTTPQQTVVVQQAVGQPIYIIQPTNPQVVYVPQYDPTVVYAGPGAGTIIAASLIGFGIGIGIAALFADSRPWGWRGWGWNWGGHSIYYNHGVWGGWHGGYRPPRPWYRPRPIVWGNRPGYQGNWHYRPPNYRPPTHVSRPNTIRPGANNRPAFSRPPSRPGSPAPGARPGSSGRPTTSHPVTPNRPATPPAQPPPAAPRPPQSHPATSQRPQQPQPGQRPQPQRPTAGNQPSHSARPAPQAKPTAQPHNPPSHNRERPTARPSGEQGDGQPHGPN